LLSWIIPIEIGGQWRRGGISVTAAHRTAWYGYIDQKKVQFSSCSVSMLAAFTAHVQWVRGSNPARPTCFEFFSLKTQSIAFKRNFQTYISSVITTATLVKASV
jgi:hypothetical protein